MPAAVADELEARVELGSGRAQQGIGDGHQDSVGRLGEKVADFGQAGGLEFGVDALVDDAINHGVGDFPEPAIPGAASGFAQPARGGDVLRRVIGRRDYVRCEGEGGEGHAVFFGDAPVHGEEVAGDEQVGLGHDRVHTGDHLRDVFFGAYIDLAELVDGRANFLETPHPVAEVGLFPLWAEWIELNAGGLDFILVMGDGGEAHMVAGLLQRDRQGDYGIDVAGGAV